MEYKPPVFCDATNCKHGNSVNYGDSCFDCEELEKLSEQGYVTFENDDSLPMCPSFRARYTREGKEKMQQEIFQAEADIASLKHELECILERAKPHAKENVREIISCQRNARDACTWIAFEIEGFLGQHKEG